MSPSACIVDAGLVVIAVQLCRCDDAQKIFVATGVFYEEHQTERLLVLRCTRDDVHIMRCNEDFRTDDGFDSALFCFDGKVNRTIDCIEVGNGNGIHAVALCSVKEVVYFCKTMEETKIRMCVEVTKFHKKKYYHEKIVPVALDKKR